MSLNPRLRDRFKHFIIIMSVVLGLALVQPFLWGAVHRMSNRLHENQSKLRQIAEVKKRIKDVQRDRDDQSVLLEQLTTVAPEDKDILNVLERLEGVAQQIGVALEISGITEDESLSAGKIPGIQVVVPVAALPVPAMPETATPSVTKTYRVFPLVVTVSVMGSATQLLTYIDAIERVQELTQIRSLTLNPEGMTAEIIFYLQEQNND